MDPQMSRLSLLLCGGGARVDDRYLHMKYLNSYGPKNGDGLTKRLKKIKSIMNFGNCRLNADMTISKSLHTFHLLFSQALAPFKGRSKIQWTPKCQSMSLLLCGTWHELMANFPYSIFEFLLAPKISQQLKIKIKNQSKNNNQIK